MFERIDQLSGKTEGDSAGRGARMKKRIVIVTTIIFAMLSLSGCNKQIFDMTYTFDRCQIRMPDGSIIEGEIETWTDYEDGDQIQVKIDGVYYLVHSNNIVLISHAYKQEGEG